MTSDAQFRAELDYFKREVDTGLQALFTSLTYHVLLYQRHDIYRRLNKTPWAWSTLLHGLQCTSFIVLGRIFDQDPKSRHNVDRLMRFASDVTPNRAHDLRRLRRHIATARKIYETKPYRDIRHKVVAHAGVVGVTDTQELFSRTTIGEVKQLFLFLSKLERALREMHVTGRKPVLRQQPHSVKKFLKKRSGPGEATSTQEIAVKDFQRFLESLVEKE